MSIEQMESSKSVNEEFLTSITKKIQQYINLRDFKEAFGSLASDINDNPTIDEFQKKVLIGLSMDFRNKKDLSLEDVNTFLGFVKQMLSE